MKGYSTSSVIREVQINLNHNELLLHINQLDWQILKRLVIPRLDKDMGQLELLYGGNVIYYIHIVKFYPFLKCIGTSLI